MYSTNKQQIREINKLVLNITIAHFLFSLTLHHEARMKTRIDTCTGTFHKNNQTYLTGLWRHVNISATCGTILRNGDRVWSNEHSVLWPCLYFCPITPHANRIYVAPHYIWIVNCISCTYFVNGEIFSYLLFLSDFNRTSTWSTHL
jgi:hypothetical protein